MVESKPIIGDIEITDGEKGLKEVRSEPPSRTSFFNFFFAEKRGKREKEKKTKNPDGLIQQADVQLFP